MADNITLTIDGRNVEVPPGTLILQAAKMLGIVIPTFCYDDRLRSVGACRMCLVEVEKSPKLVASCATPVAPGMVVYTTSPRVIKARKGVLEFLLINHPLDCPTCDKGGECPLQDLTYDYGPTTSRYKENKIRFIEDINQKFDEIKLGPEILIVRNRCIMCYKCIRIVREQAGEADLGVFKRGAFANIHALDELAFADEFSGNTVEYCPVGALLSSSFRYKIRDWLLKHTSSVCNLCPVGCNMRLDWSGDKVYRHMSRRNDEVEQGWLCDRGRYGFDITGAEDRILKPQIKRGASLEPCSFDEAAMVVAKHLRKIIDENRGSEVAAVGSALLSNEEAYAIRRFFNEVIKTSEIDFQTDTTQPLEAEQIDLIGLSGTLGDLESDPLFLFVGCDPAVEQPVATLRIKKAISANKAKAIFLGSYDKRLGNFPTKNVRIPFGLEPEALDYIISVLSGDNSGGDSRFDSEPLLKIADLIRQTGKVHIISGRSFFNHFNRDKFLSSLLALKKVSNGKLSILPSQGNFIGVSHFGLFGEPEHSFSKILERIDAGEIKTFFVFGANPIEEYPDRKFVQEALKKLEFLVVVSPFIHPTAAMAGVVFPQAMLPDYGGTFVNLEGRIQLFKPMENSLKLEVKPAWGIINELSGIMEIGSSWYSDIQIREDIANRLKEMEGLANIPDRGFIFPFINQDDYQSKLNSVTAISKAPAEYPYILQWMTSVHHNGWLTEKSENLMRIAGHQVALINPIDATHEGLVENQIARIGTDTTAINIPINISDKVNRGEILIINSFSKNPVNRLLKKDKPITYVSVKKA
ncbi:MAG TPA: NADH dehydrogenase (quinone) subunit G [candidate division Zixibacteria bacterium]|nr:NADH dehydrogenase (quinone) subunit G [candidate division Zixibacteria bacterium]